MKVYQMKTCHRLIFIRFVRTLPNKVAEDTSTADLSAFIVPIFKKLINWKLYNLGDLFYF
ncbi:hypothetical protein GCM10027577_00210 [Spirosoma fluminis]